MLVDQLFLYLYELHPVILFAVVLDFARSVVEASQLHGFGHKVPRIAILIADLAPFLDV